MSHSHYLLCIAELSPSDPCDVLQVQPAKAANAAHSIATSGESKTSDDSDMPMWRHEVPGYDVGQVIGVGGFCKVRLGIELATGHKLAFKIVEKAQAAKVSMSDASSCKALITT